MAVTGIYLLHKIWCNIQKNDHMIATLIRAQKVPWAVPSTADNASPPAHGKRRAVAQCQRAFVAQRAAPELIINVAAT
jgi:hypothetical protein